MDGCWDVVWGGVEAVEALIFYFYVSIFSSSQIEKCENLDQNICSKKTGDQF